MKLTTLIFCVLFFCLARGQFNIGGIINIGGEDAGVYIWSDWNPWSECDTGSADCGTGMQSTTRDCVDVSTFLINGQIVVEDEKCADLEGESYAEQECSVDCTTDEDEPADEGGDSTDDTEDGEEDSDDSEMDEEELMCVECYEACLDAIDQFGEFSDQIDDFISIIGGDVDIIDGIMGLIFDDDENADDETSEDGGRRQLLFGDNGGLINMNCDTPCIDDLGLEPVCANGITYACSLSAMCSGEYWYENGKCDVGLGGSCRTYDPYQGEWEDSNCLDGLYCEPYLPPGFTTSDVVDALDLFELVDGVDELEEALMFLGFDIDLTEILDDLLADLIGENVDINIPQVFTSFTLPILLNVIGTLDLSAFEVDDFLVEYALSQTGLDMLIDADNIDLSANAAAVLEEFANGFDESIMYTCQSQVDVETAGANEICRIGDGDDSFWSTECHDEGYHCMLNTVSADFSFIYTCQDPTADIIILPEGASCQYAFEDIIRVCEDGTSCAPGVDILNGITMYCQDTGALIDNVDLLPGDMLDIIDGIFGNITDGEIQFEAEVESCSLSCFSECNIELSYCVDELDLVFEGIQFDPTGLLVLPTCDILTSFIDCTETISIEGIQFKLENLCCETCVDQDFDGSACVDHLEDFESVAPTCTTLAGTIGCASGIEIAGIDFAVADVCCETCADFDYDTDNNCIDLGEGLLDSPCATIAEIHDCEDWVTDGELSIQTGVVCCETCENYENIPADDSCFKEICTDCMCADTLPGEVLSGFDSIGACGEHFSALSSYRFMYKKDEFDCIDGCCAQPEDKENCWSANMVEDETTVGWNVYKSYDETQCVIVITPGCTDSEALNYDSQANEDDGSCSYEPEGIDYSICGIKVYENVECTGALNGAAETSSLEECHQMAMDMELMQYSYNSDKGKCFGVTEETMEACETPIADESEKWDFYEFWCSEGIVAETLCLAEKVKPNNEGSLEGQVVFEENLKKRTCDESVCEATQDVQTIEECVSMAQDMELVYFGYDKKNDRCWLCPESTDQGYTECVINHTAENKAKIYFVDCNEVTYIGSGYFCEGNDYSDVMGTMAEDAMKCGETSTGDGFEATVAECNNFAMDGGFNWYSYNEATGLCWIPSDEAADRSCWNTNSLYAANWDVYTVCGELNENVSDEQMACLGKENCEGADCFVAFKSTAVSWKCDGISQDHKDVDFEFCVEYTLEMGYTFMNYRTSNGACGGVDQCAPEATGTSWQIFVNCGEVSMDN